MNTLPAPICPKADEPPVEQYFRMSGAVAEEQFCLLLSRSELDMNTIAQKIEAEKGPLHERIGRVFGSEVISPAAGKVAMNGNRLTFDATSARQNVLPLVFYIELSK